jgi:hypothetical protein
MNSSFSISGGTSNEGSGPSDSTAASLGDAAGAADGASDAACEAGAALWAVPPLLHAARNAAVADIVLAHMKPRRLSGVPFIIWRTIRSMS